jgi:hypothetical protein
LAQAFQPALFFASEFPETLSVPRRQRSITRGTLNPMLRRLLPLLAIAAAIHASERPFVRLQTGTHDRYIVELRRNATIAQFRGELGALARRTNGLAPTIRREYNVALVGAAVEIPDREVTSLRKLPSVRAVYPDRILTTCAIPADRVVAATIDAAARVNATTLPTRGAGVRVGVIDTGVDYNHPALGGGFGPGHKVEGGWDFVANDADPMDEHGHGTHVAGIIAADSAELSGVAPDATIIAYRVLNRAGAGFTSDILAAIERSMDPNLDGNTSDHLDVINLSLGGVGTADGIESQVVDNATAAGVVVVVAAGNEGQFDTVRSPGTARTAITVAAIDDAGNVASFSSKGPSPAVLELKPDVAAPGVNVVSANMGGGVVAHSGTSMACPHVAGVAALLIAMHPDWSAADVKSAIITGATALSDSQLARGSGRVDAARATSLNTFVDSSGLSYGLASGTSGVWTRTRTVTISNHHPTPRVVDITASSLPAGMTFTSSPQHLEIPANGSMPVQLRFDIDNTIVGFPEAHVLGGEITFAGADILTLPWIVLRAGRMTVSIDGIADALVAVSPTSSVIPPMYEYNKGEFFGAGGSSWDLIMTSTELVGNDPRSERFVIAQNRLMTDDEEVALRVADASVKLTLAAQNKNGRNLGEVAFETWGPSQMITLSLDYAKESNRFQVDYGFGKLVPIYVTPVSSNFRLYPFQGYVDLYRGDTYNVQFDPIIGVSEPRDLTVDFSRYTHAKLFFNQSGRDHFFLSECLVNGVQEGSLMDLHSQSCFGDYFNHPVAVDYYTTSDSGAAASGIMFNTDEGLIPALRGIDGEIVSTELTPSSVAYHIKRDEEINVADQPMFPLAFFGLMNGGGSMWLRWGYTGSIGEFRYNETQHTKWRLLDAHDEPKMSGELLTRGDGPPFISAGDRLIETRDGLQVGGMPSQVELEARFGIAGLDFVAPSFTGLRIVDATGRIVPHVRPFTAPSLEFSAVDWTIMDDMTTVAMPRELTKAWYRPTGTNDWLALPVVFSGEDNGSLLSSGHVPLGDLYRADMTAVTSSVGPKDLRLEAEDALGNHVTWTQSPAFVVQGPKRRSIGF